MGASQVVLFARYYQAEVSTTKCTGHTACKAKKQMNKKNWYENLKERDDEILKCILKK
jgi:hypothetical protein